MAALRAKVVAHRDTFVTEADMVNLALNGVNAIRIPVGYWLLAGTQVRCSRFAATMHAQPYKSGGGALGFTEASAGDSPQSWGSALLHTAQPCVKPARNTALARVASSAVPTAVCGSQSIMTSGQLNRAGSGMAAPDADAGCIPVFCLKQ